MDKLKVEIEVYIPVWTKWIAVDEDGCAYAFENKPIKYEGFWDKKSGVEGYKGYLYDGLPPKNWKEELYTWG